MTTYVVGDLHGCLEPLQRLLDLINYNPGNDQLWFVGDLINRGPQSLETLRYVRSLGNSATCILGNHDLHLLAVKAGSRKPSPKDTLDEILQADDAEELCDWLRMRPLIHHDPHLNATMVHAGILPGWALQQALTLAHQVEARLRADDYLEFLLTMYGNEPAQWQAGLTGADLHRFVINSFTRMRYVYSNSLQKLDFSYNGPIPSAPSHLLPWHLATVPQLAGGTLFFGHWSSLEGDAGAAAEHGVIALDKGCVWGGSLAAVAIESGEYFDVAA